MQVGRLGTKLIEYYDLLAVHNPILIIDPAQKVCIVRSHLREKNKGVARGHPVLVALHKSRISNVSKGNMLFRSREGPSFHG